MSDNLPTDASKPAIPLLPASNGSGTLVFSLRMLAFGMTALSLVAAVTGDAKFWGYTVAISNLFLWLSLIAEPKSPNDQAQRPGSPDAEQT